MPLVSDDYRRQKESLEERLRLTVGNQLNYDPEHASRVLRLEGQTGLPSEFIEDNVDYLEKEVQIQGFDAERIRQKSPKWARFAAENPFHLAVLKDDEENMTRTEWVIDALFDWKAVGQAAKSSFSMQEMSMIGKRQRRLGGPQEGDAERLKELRKYSVGHDFDTSGLKMLVVAGASQSAQFLGSMKARLKRGAIVGAEGAAIGAMYGAAGGTAILPGGGTAVGALGLGAFGWGVGFTVGSLWGGFEYGRDVEGGSAYLEYRDMGFSHSDAAWASDVAGNLNGLIEAVGGQVLFSRLPGVRNLTGRAGEEITKQLMGRVTFRQVAARAAKDWGVGVAAEVSEEILQESTTITMGEILKAQNDRDDMITSDEWISRITDIAVMTFKSTVLLAGFGPGQRLITDGKRSRDARGRMLAFKALGESSKDSKLRKNVPPKYREFVDKLTESGEVDHILIDAEHFDEYFQNQGMDPDEVAKDLGIENLEAARELGTKLEIPVGAYAEKIAPTEHHAGLAKDISTREGDMTFRQHEEFEKIRPELEKELNALLEPVDDAAGAEKQLMLKDITAQLIAADTEPRLAQQQAQIMVGMLNLDEKMGFEPGTLLTRFFAGVRKDLPAGVQGKDFDIYIDPLLNKLRTGEFPSQREMMGPSLIDMITEAGGINLADSELVARDFELSLTDMGLSKAALKKWRKEGRSLDDIAELAAEAGYIVEHDEKLLLEAIDAEISGQAVFGTGAPGDPVMQALGEKLDELASFIAAEDIDLDVLSNAEVRALLEAGEKFEQIDFEALHERMQSQDLAQMMSGMPHIFSQQDFGDVAFTDTVRIQETDEVHEVTEFAQTLFDLEIKRRNGLRQLLGCVSG